MARFSNQMRIIAMTQIGAFTQKEDGFFGRVRTLVFDAEVSILPIDESDTENRRQTIASSVTAWKLARPGIAPATVPVRTSP